MNREEKEQGLSKLALQILAMLTMLIDHIGADLYPGAVLLRCIGRLAFPIFAFFIAEGCERTHDMRRYIGRMLAFALISEIPFDFSHGNMWDMEHQNVMWTFLIAMLCICTVKRLHPKGKNMLGAVLTLLIAAAGFALGELIRCDYGGWGVWTVLLFWGCRGRSWRYSAELAGMFGIHWRTAIASLCMEGKWLIPIQGLCLFALPFLWLYRGKKGYQSRAVQYICYAFYPAHLLVIGLIAGFVR